MKTTTTKKTGTKKLSLCKCKRNIWNLHRRYRMFTERVTRTTSTFGILRA